MTQPIRSDPAFPDMVMDILSNILGRAEHPGELGRYLTEELRELTGARLVVLLDCHARGERPSHRVIGFNPQRHQSLLDTPEMTRLIDLVHHSDRLLIWFPKQEQGEAARILNQWGFSLSIGIPLEIATTRVGSIFIFGLPEDDTHLTDEIEILKTLSSTVALVLRNALVYEDRERLIEERTRQFRAVNAELQQSKTELARANRALRAVLACNEVLVHATQDTELLNDICRIIVDIGGYSMAWVGMPLQDADQSIKVVAKAGERDAFLSRIRLSWADMGNGIGPTGRAIRDGKPVIVHDIASHQAELLKPAEVIRLGYAAILALPLNSGSERLGALTIFASEPDAFNQEEIELLSGLAKDLVFGLQTMHTRSARQQAETRLALNAIHAQTLSSLSETLVQASPNLQRVLELAAERIAQSLGDGCIIRLLSEDRQRVHVASFHHNNPGTMALIEQTLGRIDWPTDTQVVSIIVNEGQSLFFPRISLQELTSLVGLSHEDLTQVFSINSIMFVPLYSQGETAGMVTVLRDQTEIPYTLDDLTFLQDMADRTGMVYTNAILFAKVEDYSNTLEQRVLERTRQLEAANKELESFSYSISHDLRSPLRAIDGFSRAVLDDYGGDIPPEARRLLGRVCANSQQMGQLIDGLLEFSRLGRKPLTRAHINTSELVQRVIDGLEHEWKNRQVEFVVADLPSIYGDALLMKQVFVNLISNALKFTRRRETARIEIGYSPGGGDSGCFFIKDNGIGFDPQYSDRLFGVFQRLQKAEDYEGTGVGLAIVQRIIQRHGGRVWAKAAVNEGASFFFSIEGE